MQISVVLAIRLQTDKEKEPREWMLYKEGKEDRGLEA
jgi:hypothetical protein